MGKITAYTSLSSAESNDLLVVVDVNDTTMAPSGTDKKITVGALLAAADAGIPTGLAPSGDETGATDPVNVQGLINLGAKHIRLQSGTFYGDTTVTSTSPPTYVDGAGKWATVWNYIGTGDAFRWYTTSSYSPGGPAGGGLRGFTIDISGAGNGSSCVHAGDIYNLEFDIGVRGAATSGASSKNAWFDNNYWWAEQMHGRIWSEEGPVVFDNSADTSGSATGSFDRMDLGIYADGKGKSNLVVFQNGAFCKNGAGPKIFGNTDYGSSLYYVLTITGSNGSGYSGLANCGLNIGVECNGTTGTQPGTINFGTAGPSGNYIEGCTGLLDFSANNAFATANNVSENFQFEGPVFGDGKLQRVMGMGNVPYQQGTITNGSLITTRYNSITRVEPASNVTGITMSGFDPLSGQVFWLVNDSTYTITFAAEGTSKVMGGTAVTVAANSAMQFIWNDSEVAWFPVSPPSAIAAAPQLALAPSGATGQTADRQLASQYLSGLTSETVYCSAITLPAGTPVNGITLVVGGTAFTLADVTHGWYALLDSGLAVRAVSADQTSGNWGTTYTPVPLSVAASDYVTTYSGLYYVAFCATFTGTSGEFPAVANPVGGLGGLAPVLAGTSSTGETTPPATGTTLAALSGTFPTNARFYAYTS